jgi:hypothetical protein
MALQYDNFGLRRIVVEANLWPPVQEIAAATLSQLFGAVNEDDTFATCELRPGGATFDGEAWDYNINGSTVVLRWWGTRPPDDLDSRIRRFLDGTRVVAMDHQVGFYTEEIRVFADVPEGKNRDIGEVVKKRLLKGMKAEDRESLTGLMGAGLRLRGVSESYVYQANIDPKSSGDMLNLFAGLKFKPEAEPPRPGPDLDLIERQRQIACAFVAEELVEFSRKLFP